MKKLTIYKRTISVRTGFRKYPFKDEIEYILFYGGEKVWSNTNKDIDDPRLRVKFDKVFESQSRSKANEFIKTLSKCFADKQVKTAILLVLEW